MRVYFSQTVPGHDFGVFRFASLILDNVEFAFAHFDFGQPPTTRFHLVRSGVNLD